MNYDTFSDLMSKIKDLNYDIPITDERSAPLVEFYRYWSNYLEPTPAYMAYLPSMWGGIAKGFYFITASLEHVFNNLFKLFGLFGYLGNQETLIGQFFYWFQVIGTTLFSLILVTSAITGVFTKPVKYKGIITNFLLVTLVTSVLPFALTSISSVVAQDAQNIQTLGSITKDSSTNFSSLAIQPIKNNTVDIKVLVDNDFSTELFPMDDHGFIKPIKEGSTPLNNITDSPDKRDTSDFASRIDFSATFGATDMALLETLENKQKGLKGLFLHQLNATQDGILTINEHRIAGGLNAFEPVYLRYKVNWIGMFGQYIILIVLLLSMAIKLVKSIFDIVIQAMISPLQGYSSLSNSKKYKELLRTMGGALAGIFFEVVIMRVTLEILRDLPTLTVSAVIKLSGGFFDGLNSWEQMIAACVVYIGVFFAAMQGVSMIERWLGVSTGHNETAQQLLGAMMMGNAFATGAGAIGNGAMAVGGFGVDMAKKAPGFVANGSKVLGNSLAVTGGGIRGAINAGRDQGMMNAAKGGLSNMVDLADVMGKEAINKGKEFVGGVSEKLGQKEQAAHDAVYRGLKDHSLRNEPRPVSPYDPDANANFEPVSSEQGQTSPLYSDDSEVGGREFSEPVIESAGEQRSNFTEAQESQPYSEASFSGVSDPTTGPIEMKGEPGLTDKQPSSKDSFAGVSDPTKQPKMNMNSNHKPKLQQSMNQMTYMNQQMQQAGQRMQGQGHIRGAEIEEDDSQH